MLTTFARENIYIMNQIKFELNKLALTTIMMSLIESMTIFSTLSTVTNTNELRSIHRIESFNSMQLDESHHESNQFDFSNFENNTSSKKRDFYTLWHRRSDHLKSAKLKNFHKVTTLKKSILIIEQRESCEVCSITKMINRRNRHLIERKTQILKLIFIDICDSLLTSRLNYEYFLKIVDNRSRKTWILFLRNRAKEVKALRKWKLRIELQCQIKLLTIRNDNVLKLKFILNEWCKFIDIVSQYTISYNFNQNDVTKRDIKITKNQIRAMIQDANLFMKFWFEIDEIDAYVRNRVVTRLIVNDNSINSMKAFIEIKSSIDHLRVWDCKCYFSIDIRSLFKDVRTNKLINTERLCVFMSYDENIITQYLMWTSDRQQIIKHHRMIFSKNEK